MFHFQDVPQKHIVPQPAPRPAIILDRWQYRLTAAPHPGARRCCRHWLSVGAGLATAKVVDDSGTDCGMLLGFPIDLAAANLIDHRWQVPKGGGVTTDAAIHKTLRALGGRFLWIAPHPRGTRVYPDAAAQITCVWDAAGGEVGATAGAILQPSDYNNRLRTKLFDRMKIKGEGWFPAGLTAHEGVERLLPNHYLDLQNWTARRFTAIPPSDPKPSEVVDALRASIRAHVLALRKGPRQPAVALTAGRESRAILACLRDQAHDLRFVTVTGDDRHQTDTVMAKRIAATFGLRHETLPRCVADTDAQNRFLKRGGHCFGDSNILYHPSVAPLADNRVFAGGLGGEIARAFYWDNSDSPDMVVTPGMLMQRFGLPTSRIVEAALLRWLDGLPDITNARDILDLAYLELRLGPWAMAQFCADPSVPRFAPMITYDTVRLMLDLPEDWRVGKRLNAAIVARHWPALDTFPYNTLGAWQDKWVKLQRILDNPRIVMKKLRQSRFIAAGNILRNRN